MTPPVSIGAIGLGGWGRGMVEKIRETPTLRLVGCCDVDAARASALGQTWSCAATSSVEELLAMPGLEAVAIFTPNSRHREGVEAAAAAGKHVFVEKPIAVTTEDGRAMIAACERAGVTLMVGHNMRRHSPYRRLKALLEAEEAGQVVMVEGHTGHAGGLSVTADQWRWLRAECPGGPLMQLGVHHMDTYQYLFGPARAALAAFGKTVTASEIEDATLSIVEMASGVLCYLGSNYVAPHVQMLNVYGTRANLLATGESLRIQRPEGVEEVALEPVDAMREEVEEFARCIRQGVPPETGGPEGLAALAMVRACLTAAETGCRTLVEATR